MNARLDPSERVIAGDQILTWTNTTDHATSELRYHLYYNAWRNDRSSFLTASHRRAGDISDHAEGDWAYSDVAEIRVLERHGWDAAELSSNMEFIQPDDGNEHDRTVLRVPLPRPIGPGETVSIALSWVAKVPRTFARTGVRGDYYFLAQWFPKVGVLEPGGSWNCHQFIQTEFFADFGTYDVRLTVPTGWAVGATGRETETEDNGDGTTTHRFVQDDVHDFAWTTTPDYTVYTDRFEHKTLPPVDIRLLLMPDHAGQEERYLEATRTTLERYGTWLGAYPYGHVTVVDPAYRAGAGGMEYPTLFTGGSHWLAPVEGLQPEGVTIHECGHQFWYGLIANNEFEHAWLDEGFNTYTQSRVMSIVYPERRYMKRYFEEFLPVVFSDVVLAGRTDGADQYATFDSPLKRDPIELHSWRSGPGSYRVNAYNKAALVLRTLENHLGWDTFQRALSTYFQRFKLSHPRPEDFVAVVEEVAGRDLSWFFDQTIHDTAVFDYAVGTVRSRTIREPHGYDDDLEFHEAWDDDDEGEHKTAVFVRRWGDGVFPVDVRVTFADGTEAHERWDGRARWTRFDYVGSRVDRVEVDPGRVLALDLDRANNTWLRTPRTNLAAVKWSSKWLFWVQNLMEAFAFFS